MKMRVGSRKSDLAQIQSRIVAETLKSVQPDLEVEFVFKDVGVDLNLNISLVEAESKGLFTKDLSQDLIQGRIDAVVHSWKDLPTAGPAETTVVATLLREDPRDLVFVKKTALNKKEITFLSSSPRREENLGRFVQDYVFPQSKLTFLAVRGNLPTRMKKFMESDGDALVLALAAVKRLLQYGNEESRKALAEVMAICEVLVVPVINNPPAPAQGALAIEIKKDRKDLVELFSKINHVTSFEDVIAERERLKDFGGGCHLKLGIYQRSTERGTLKIERGLTPDGAPLSLTQWEPLHPLPKVNPKAFFDATELKYFERNPLNASKPSAESPCFYLVSKAEALPENWLKTGDVLWVAGLESWKKLREKGHWVSGSNESLGESFMELPLELWPSHRVLKLAHNRAPQGVGELLSTYELVAKKGAVIPTLKPYEIFYWPSGSLFLACLEHDPSIVQKLHVCGLGNTFDELKKHIPQERLFCVLNREDCLPQF
ncbi:MAG: hydroxymethylbilane synthase [Bdellovibrionota bacterium]